MKRLVSIFAVMLMSLTVSAQFVTFEPVVTDRNGNRVEMNSGYNRSNNYYNPYNNYNPYYNQYYNTTPQRPQQQQSQVISTRGYYIKNNQWQSVLIRVKVVGDDVYLVGVKRSSTGWSNCNTKVYSTQLMRKEIKDNFDYYAGDYICGNIYF